jgi:putative transposase
MKKLALRLNDSDRIYLEGYVNKGTHSARAIKRARVLLLLDAGKSVKESAAIAGVSQATVYNVVQRHRQVKGSVCRAIEEKARPGQPAKITPEVEAHITALACSKAPSGRSQWTLRLLSEKVVELGYVDELSHEAVRKCLKKVNSSPGRKNNGASGR